jgi:hypothetical protein
VDRRQPNRCGGSDRALLVGRRERRNVARYFAREREKQELRRERDAVMLRIAGDLGIAVLAQQLDVTPAVVDKLLADARERLGAGSSGSEPTITVRRLAADRDRWVDVDTYYEALGSRPAIRPRPMPPQG